MKIRSNKQKIGLNRNAPRLWIQGQYLQKAGFKVGLPISIDYKVGSIVITPDPSSNIKVAHGGSRPQVIDINNLMLGQCFDCKEVMVNVYEGKIKIEKCKGDFD